MMTMMMMMMVVVVVVINKVTFVWKTYMVVSGNFTAVKEMSGNCQGRLLSWKNFIFINNFTFGTTPVLGSIVVE